jgi:PBP1b-binding outer membrane lipoprotein LpoB
MFHPLPRAKPALEIQNAEREGANLMKRLFALSALALLVAGCHTPRTGYVPTDESGVMTVQLDDHDYDIAVNNTIEALLEMGVPAGKVLAIGPVNVLDCKYPIQVNTLQNSIQTALNREGSVKFVLAKDLMANSEVTSIYETIRYNWEKKGEASPEEIKMFAKLADVDVILFGRVSCLERDMAAEGREVTYRFVWKFADVETGLLDKSNECKLRKNVKYRPHVWK